MTSKGARLPKLAAVAVVLIAAGILLWPRDGSDRLEAPVARTARMRTAAPLPAPMPAAASSAPAAPALPSMHVAPASSSASDPFRAYLELHRGQALPSASQPALAAPIDPFKAAIEAGRRGEPVPTVSPFGAKQ